MAIKSAASLKDQMGIGGGASMVPKEYKPYTPKEPEEPRVDLRDVPGLTVNDRAAIRSLVAESKLWADQERDAKKARKPITERLKAILEKYGVDAAGRFESEGVAVDLYYSSRTSLSKEMLLSNGVPPSIINACTVVKPVLTLRVGGTGSGGEE